MSLCATLLAVALLLGVAACADAQIYSWRDAGGNLVLSNTHRPDGARADPATPPPAGQLDATRLAVAVERGGAERDRSGNALYDTVIGERARLAGVRESLVRAVVQVESGFNPNARSPRGAMGLMQLMPATAARYGVANPFNPDDNVRAGVQYLRELLDRYHDDETLALAAYNAGPGAVDAHGQQVPPYSETQDYVARVSRIAESVPVVEERRAAGGIFTIVEVIGGREVPRYTNHPRPRQ